MESVRYERHDILTIQLADGKRAPNRNRPRQGPKVAPEKLNDACKIEKNKTKNDLNNDMLITPLTLNCALMFL